jgi:hypothetical protein
MTWYSLSWNYRLPVTVTNGSSTSALSYAQVGVSLTGSAYTSITTHGLSNLADIVVTDSDGVTTLPFALEGIDTTNSVVYLLVKMSLAANVAKTIYVYYGNASASSTSSYSGAITPTASATLNVDILTQTQSSGYNSNPGLICLKNQIGANASRNGMLIAFHMRGGSENGASNGKLGLLTCSPGADPTQAANWANSVLCTPASGSGFSPIMAGELANGTILCLYEYGTNAQLDAGTGMFFIGKSTDGGQTWTNMPPNAATTAPANPLTLPSGATYGTTGGLYWGRFVELTAGGDLLAPWYGVLGSDTVDLVRVMKCPSGSDPSIGSNWVDTGVNAMRGGSQVQNPSDPTFCLTAANHIICLARNDNPSSSTGGGDLWVSRSTDGGATWSAMAALGMPALQAGSGATGNVTPVVSLLQSGNFLLSWGQRNNTASGVGGLGSYCALSTDGCASFFDRPFAGSCEVSQGGGFRSDFGWPSTAQLPNGNIVSLCYRGISANATTNIVCSVFTEDWVANQGNVYNNCETSTGWTLGAGATVDSTHAHNGTNAIKMDNTSSTAATATLTAWSNAAKMPGKVAASAWTYITQTASGTACSLLVRDTAAASLANISVFQSPFHALWYNGSAYQNTGVVAGISAWYKWTEIFSEPGNLGNILVNDASVATNQTEYGTAVLPKDVYFLAGSTAATHATTWWVDDVQVHQYIAAPPTLSTGSEQSAPVTSASNSAILLVA